MIHWKWGQQTEQKQYSNFQATNAEMAGLNPAEGLDVHLLCRVLCIVCDLDILTMKWSTPESGWCATDTEKVLYKKACHIWSCTTQQNIRAL